MAIQFAHPWDQQILETKGITEAASYCFMSPPQSSKSAPLLKTLYINECGRWTFCKHNMIYACIPHSPRQLPHTWVFFLEIAYHCMSGMSGQKDLKSDFAVSTLSITRSNILKIKMKMSLNYSSSLSVLNNTVLFFFFSVLIPLQILFFFIEMSSLIQRIAQGKLRHS